MSQQEIASRLYKIIGGYHSVYDQPILPDSPININSEIVDDIVGALDDVIDIEDNIEILILKIILRIIFIH